MAFTLKSRTSVAILGILTAAASACSTTLAPLSSGTSMISGLTSGTKTAAHRFTLKFNKTSRVMKFKASRADLPASIDMRAKCSPIADQGQLGSCTAFAWGKGMAEFLAIQKGDKTPLSAIFFYVKELEMENHLGQDAGAESMETGGKTLTKFGDAPDVLSPYLSSADQMSSAKIKKALSTLPNAKQLEAALPYRAAKVTPVADLAAAKEQLAAGRPVAMGIMVYESFQSPAGNAGNIPVPKDGEQVLGGHAVLAVGYDDAKKVLIMRNSWGTSWGDKGWFYLPYEYVKGDRVLDCWSANN
ncbi:MAG: C1 family peptidase [Candidatus Sericytochromatia bacterium]|nr:C1 family peptidase [Candidatus Sericytochromatia bacterium]